MKLTVLDFLKLQISVYVHSCPTFAFSVYMYMYAHICKVTKFICKDYGGCIDYFYKLYDAWKTSFKNHLDY